MSTDITQIANKMINEDFVQELKETINARNRWSYIGHGCDFGCHALIASTIILSFMSAGLHIPLLAVIAGIVGTSSQALRGFGQYATVQYKNSSQMIQQMSEKVGSNDILQNEENIIVATNNIVQQQRFPLETPVALELRLPTETPTVPPSTPVQHANTPT